MEQEGQKGPGAIWQPIETAPKDGSHFLGCDASRPYEGWWTFNQMPPIVAHWWDSIDEEGFYASFASSDVPLRLTHWMPLPTPPQATRGSL